MITKLNVVRVGEKTVRKVLRTIDIKDVEAVVPYSGKTNCGVGIMYTPQAVEKYRTTGEAFTSDSDSSIIVTFE